MGEGISISEMKAKYPVYKNIPDDQFKVIDGKLMLSRKGLIQLAFQLKNKVLYQLANGGWE
ncbi:hypothetical protein [Bacillus marasmi]|uniref:hypothetical protein n=1 Tax=Bacillus marasmi TaxID=1926279 RepID=UPI0011CC8EB5|nr:hypothetical protein [Bacillus marasmi]